MKRFNHGWLTLLIVFGLVLSACAAPQAPPPAPERPAAERPAAPTAELTREQKLVEGARKEGSVVFWSFGDTEEGEAALKLFKEKYPFLEVKAWYAGAAASAMIPGRVLEEAKAGRHNVDMIYVSEKHLLPNPLWKEVIAEYEWPNTRDWPFLRGHNYYRIIAHSPMVTTYNASLVTAAEAPRSWDDLKSTKWRGKAILSRSVSDVPLYFAYLWGEGSKLNWDKSFSFWREVMSNVRPKAVIGMTGPTELHAAGENPLFIMNSMVVAMRFKAIGAPLEIASAPSAFSTTLILALVKNAPHPNAARLLANYLTSNESQIIMSGAPALRVVVHPEAARKARANVELATRGIRLDEIPPEVNTPENLKKSIDFWVDLLR